MIMLSLMQLARVIACVRKAIIYFKEIIVIQVKNPVKNLEI